MRQYLVTIALLAAALACYVIGFSLGALLLAASGIALESAFWIRVWRQRRANDAPELS